MIVVISRRRSPFGSRLRARVGIHNKSRCHASDLLTKGYSYLENSAGKLVAISYQGPLIFVARNSRSYLRTADSRTNYVSRFCL